MYKNFEDARTFAQSLNLKTQREWMEWRKTDARPKDIPSNPGRQYINDGWQGWSNFLGTNNPSPQERKNNIWPFEKAREFARNTGITGKNQWREWAKTSARPSYIPTEPSLVYKEEFLGWGDWLGTGRISDNIKHSLYYSYEDAKNYLKQFNFPSEIEFYEWAKTTDRPDFIPANPRSTYKVDDNWVSMGDFLSNGNIFDSFKQFVSYEEAKEYAKKQNLLSAIEWAQWSKEGKRALNIPGNPVDFYKEQFEGWPEFLGYIRKSSYAEKVIEYFLCVNKVDYKHQYKFNDCRITNPLPFDFGVLNEGGECIALIEYYGIQHYEVIDYMGGQSRFDFTQKSDITKQMYCHTHNIPLLIISYKDKDNIEDILVDFLVKIIPNKTFQPIDRSEIIDGLEWMDFDTLKTFVHSFKFKNMTEFFKSWKNIRPKNAPFDVVSIYRGQNNWTSWGDFLGNGNVQSQKVGFASYDEFCDWARENGINSYSDWARCKADRPSNIPHHPQKIYNKQWQGWNFVE